MSQAAVVTRFAPSPTGELHLGNARTALFSWLLARRAGGRFLLRIEDSDAGRSLEAHTAALVEDLRWLGLDWDLGPGSGAAPAEWRQSARRHVYQAQLERLVASGDAYPCYCTSAELEQSRRAQPRGRAAAALRRHLPGAGRGRAGGAARGRAPAGLALPRAARRAHRVRGWRARPAGVRQRRPRRLHPAARGRRPGVLLLQCRRRRARRRHAGAARRGPPRQHAAPAAHPARARPGGASLRARRAAHRRRRRAALKRHGAPSLRAWRERGYAPEALCNLLFRLGHSTAENGLLDLAGMARHFDPAHLQRAPARFDPVQLAHWQSLWVRSLTPERAAAWLEAAMQSVPAGRRPAFVAAVLPNVTLAEDARAWAELLFTAAVTPEPEAARAIDAAGPAFFARAAAAVGEGVDVATLRAATGAKGAALFAPLRAALTGRLHGPDFGALLALLPAATVRERLSRFAQGH
ncbi:MAG: glutamate--tRNA ligase family protein [Steroidobacteraceae bacterium]